MTFIQPNNLPQSITVPYPDNTPAAQNALVPQQQARSNQNWTLKLTSNSSTQIIAFDSSSDLGFDTISLNTYKAITTSVYTLAYTGETLSGTDFPYVFIKLPQHGIYHLRAQVTVRVDDGPYGGTLNLFRIFPVINGSFIPGAGSNTIQPYSTDTGTIFQTMTSTLSIYITANAGDSLSLGGAILNDTFLPNATTITDGEFNPLFEIHYMGLS